MELLAVAVAFALVVGAALGAASARGRRALARGDAERSLDLALVEIAMPAARLSALRRALEAGDHPGELYTHRLARLLAALGDAPDAWTHVGVRSFPAGPAEGVHDRYTALVREVHAREGADVARGAAPGGYRGGGVGAGEPVLALVTIVVLATLELPEMPPARRDVAREMLDLLARAAASAVTAEIVWLPERTIDGVSLDELLARAPRLVALAEPGVRRGPVRGRDPQQT